MEPHVYVIHLRHRKDRKKQFTKAWNKTARLHWHSAILGSTLSDSKLADFRTAARTRKARAGRVGCYLSHVAAIKKAVSRNHFPLLILEDDAVPTSDDALGSLFASAPPSTLLYFGALPVKDRKRVNCHGAGWRRPPTSTQLYGGHAYGFPTRAAAEEVLAFLEENKMTLDSALIRWTKANRTRVAVYCPFQFIQSEGFSDIEGTVRGER